MSYAEAYKIVMGSTYPQAEAEGWADEYLEVVNMADYDHVHGDAPHPATLEA